MRKKQLPVQLQRREFTWGIRYLLFQLIFLGALLSFLLTCLGLKADGIVLDTAYFAVNLGAVIWIFHSYLWQSLKHGISYLGKLLLATVIGFAVYYGLTRGLVFGALHPRSRMLAYIVSTLFFSFIHVMGYIGSFSASVLLLCFLQYIPAGVMLAWAYEYSGSILAPILIHTAVNAIAIFSVR